MAIPTPVNGMITDAVTQANVKVLGDAEESCEAMECLTRTCLPPRRDPSIGECLGQMHPLHRRAAF